MSPEYAVDGLYSTKSDVYSFGVIVLEIVSGKRNRGFSHPEHNLNLLGHAWRLHMEGRSVEMIDALIKNSCNLNEVLRSIHIGLLCVQRSPEDRPSMSSVVFMLGGEGALPEPKQPGFFTEREISAANYSVQQIYSIKQISDSNLPANGLTSRCVQRSPEDRPSMSSVVFMLGGEGALPEPKQPGFFTEREISAANYSSNNHDSSSANGLTVTLLDAR
ncbi:G-type lectin S-receptor-like serine/threonine-protein kinase At4g27290 [Jatropha curcas]|uniref:G-type lectin S-receptor-like serine/threonine-protein kinase At4g27290 n=1 Tax=Jatropha curcas TaxID=180498 RepID=UPI00189544E9|nr:G-type lectin S-receptor-like serine/threonine-protein kinase At4g27290 [Jatropha curcas]